MKKIENFEAIFVLDNGREVPAVFNEEVFRIRPLILKNLEFILLNPNVFSLFFQVLLEHLFVKIKLGRISTSKREKLRYTLINFFFLKYYSFNVEELKKVYLIFKNLKVKYFFPSNNTKGLLLCNYLIHFDQIVVSDQYSLRKVKDKIKDKVVIDAGANIGEFSIFAIKLGAKKVYAFEPVKETYNILINNIKENGLEDKIIAYNIGLGDSQKLLDISFNVIADGGASLIMNTKGSQIKEKVEIDTLDNIVKENKITDIAFIKMDVEGYERYVLKGAKETIKKYKPIISCSAYHLKDDKQILPKIILEIYDKYKYKLTNYNEEDFLFYVEEVNK